MESTNYSRRFLYQNNNIKNFQQRIPKQQYLNDEQITLLIYSRDEQQAYIEGRRVQKIGGTDEKFGKRRPKFEIQTHRFLHNFGETTFLCNFASFLKSKKGKTYACCLLRFVPAERDAGVDALQTDVLALLLLSSSGNCTRRYLGL
uniref:Uncharacterized protein n=1 Tax=Solanum tuberosum TaxID=4113 RepID=M1DCV7_SOLTU